MPNRKYEMSAHEIEQLLPFYRRWIEEGEPKYGHWALPATPQYYYDPYHDTIADNGDGTMRFSIQTFDSPEGDTWVRGTFTVIDGKVSIIEQSASTH